MNIPLFVPMFRIDETLTAIRECLEKGWTGIGFKTVEFEKAWCEYTHLPHAHFLNSATAGLHLAVAQMKRRYDWQDGDEIITSPLTFVSTNHAILYEKLTPVFADVDEYLCLDDDSVEMLITPKTRAVMFVGMGGNVGQLFKVWQLCDRYRLKLILDAAHMAGTRDWNGMHVGVGPDVSVFSFQAVKNLPTGDSGMICWADPEMDAQSRKLSWLGIDKDTYSRNQSGYSWQYDVDEVGWKYNGNSIMAAMGLVALKYLDQDNAYRRELAAYYDELLEDMDIVEQKIARVPMAPDCIPSRHLYQVLIENRDEVIEILKAKGIGTGVHYIDNTQYPMYHGDCWSASRASAQLLSLPMHLQMTTSDVVSVVAELIAAVEGVKTK